MSRSQAPCTAPAIASGLVSSTKNSAGPPMPKDVRDANASSSLIPGRDRSQSTLDFVRQLIAQLLDVARAHQEQQVVRPDDLVQRLFRALERSDVRRVTHLVSQ